MLKEILPINRNASEFFYAFLYMNHKFYMYNLQSISNEKHVSVNLNNKPYFPNHLRMFIDMRTHPDIQSNQSHNHFNSLK